MAAPKQIIVFSGRKVRFVELPFKVLMQDPQTEHRDEVSKEDLIEDQTLRDRYLEMNGVGTVRPQPRTLKDYKKNKKGELLNADGKPVDTNGGAPAHKTQNMYGRFIIDLGPAPVTEAPEKPETPEKPEDDKQ